MKNFKISALFIILSLISFAATSFAQSTSFGNAVINFPNGKSMDIAIGNIVVWSTQGTVITEPFAINPTGPTTNSTQGTVITEPFTLMPNPNGSNVPSSTQGTVITEPFAVSGALSNSTNYTALGNYFNSQVFAVSTTGEAIAFQLNESTNDPNFNTDGNGTGRAVQVEIFDYTSGQVYGAPVQSLSGSNYTFNPNTSFIGFIPSACVGHQVYLSLNILWQNSNNGLAYSSMPTSSLTDISGTLGKEIAAVVPTSDVLGQNYPNPVNGVTNIPVGYVDGAATLKVYDILGRTVADLSASMPQKQSEGFVTLNTADFQNGTYFYRLVTADGIASTRQMIVRH